MFGHEMKAHKKTKFPLSTFPELNYEMHYKEHTVTL